MFKSMMMVAALSLLTACGGGVCGCKNCANNACVCADKAECACKDAAKGGVCEHCAPK